jgi:hypothetical protein
MNEANIHKVTSEVYTITVNVLINFLTENI